MRAFYFIVYRLSACHKSNSRRNLGDLSSNIIKHNHVILNTQRVEQVKHSLRHHRRTAEVVLDVLWSVVLLEVGVAHHWSNEARSVHLHKSASAFESGRSLLGIMEVRIHRSNQLEPIERLY